MEDDCQGILHVMTSQMGNCGRRLRLLAGDRSVAWNGCRTAVRKLPTTAHNYRPTRARVIADHISAGQKIAIQTAVPIVGNFEEVVRDTRTVNPHRKTKPPSPDVICRIVSMRSCRISRVSTVEHNDLLQESHLHQPRQRTLPDRRCIPISFKQRLKQQPVP